MKRRMLSLLMALCLMLTLAPSALAEGTTPDPAKGYGGADLPAAPTINGDTITVTPHNAQYTLDGAYGEIDGKTIVFSTGSYDQLELGRATKYSGSNTEYYIGGFETNQKYEFSGFVEAKNGSDYTAPPRYRRNMSNVTLKAETPGTVTIAGIRGAAGHAYGTNDGEAYDYVLERYSQATTNSYYLAQNWSNITFENLSFTAQVNIESSQPETQIHGVIFNNCSFTTGGTAPANKAGLRYYNENNDGHVTGLTVNNCKFNNCYQGVYTAKIKDIVVTDSSFTNTGHNAIAIQSGDKDPVDHGNVVITNNTFDQILDRVIRFGYVGTDTTIKLAGNTATNSGDDKGEVIKVSNLPASVPCTVQENSWGEGTKVNTGDGGGKLQDPLTEANGVAETGGNYYATLAEAIAAADDGAEVKLLKEVTLSESIVISNGANVTLNLNGNDICFGTAGKYFYVQGGTLTFTGNGKVYEKAPYYSPVMVKGSKDDTANYSVVNVGKDVTLEGWAGLFIDKSLSANNETRNYGIVANVEGTLIGKNDGSSDGYGLYVNGQIANTTGNVPQITIGSTAHLTGDEAAYGMYLAGFAQTTIAAGAVIEGASTGIEIRAGELTVNGGTITGKGTPTTVNPNGSGTTTTGAGIGIAQHTTKLPVTVTINGGTINGHTALNETNPQGNTGVADQIKLEIIDGDFVSADGVDAVNSIDCTGFVKGGNYSEEVTEGYLSKDLNAELYSTAKNEDAPYSYYTDTTKAEQDADTYGGELTLLNVEDDATIYTVTLIDQLLGTTSTIEVIDSFKLPTRGTVGYNVFIGWVNQTTNNLVAGEATVEITDDVTFTALYNAVPPYIPPVVSGNTVTTAPASNGYVTVNPANAAQNTVVTVTPVPGQGYVLSGLTVTDVNGMQVPVTANANGTYSFVMPAAPVTVSAAFAPEGPQTWTNPYADVADTAWYADAVAYVSAKGLMTGTSAVMFAPDASTTRAMIWTVLGRMSGASVDGGEPWYSLAQTWAMANGVSDGTNPNNAITREQLAAMLYRFAGEPDLLDSQLAGLNTYADSADVSDWAQEAMAWAVSNGIINGIDGKLAPQGLATRAQVAAMLMRYCENVAK